MRQCREAASRCLQQERAIERALRQALTGEVFVEHAGAFDLGAEEVERFEELSGLAVRGPDDEGVPRRRRVVGPGAQVVQLVLQHGAKERLAVRHDPAREAALVLGRQVGPCPRSKKPQFLDVKRSSRAYKNAIESRFTKENAEGA